MKKKFIKFFALVAVIAVTTVNFTVNNQSKKTNALFNSNTVFTTAAADCEWVDGYTTTCDYVVQSYCQISGPAGTLTILDCRPN